MIYTDEVSKKVFALQHFGNICWIFRGNIYLERFVGEFHIKKD